MSKRIIRRTLVLTAISMLALFGASAAEATLIEVGYVGTVDTVRGTGLGYAIGDEITGTQFIDTDAVTWTAIPCNNVNCQYYGSDLVTGSLIGRGQTNEGVVTVNDFGGAGPNVQSYKINTTSTSVFGSLTFTYETLLWAFLENGNFIVASDLIQDFSLTSADFAGLFDSAMYGRLHASVVDASGSLLYDDSASYVLSSLRVRPTTVPEPDMLALLGFGMAATTWVARRRQRKGRA